MWITSLAQALTPWAGLLLLHLSPCLGPSSFHSVSSTLCLTSSLQVSPPHPAMASVPWNTATFPLASSPHKWVFKGIIWLWYSTLGHWDSCPSLPHVQVPALLCFTLWLFKIYLFVCLFIYLFNRRWSNLLSFFKLIGLFIYFWLPSVFVAARGLSPVVASGGYSLLRCMGFSCCRARALGARASAVVARGL